MENENNEESEDDMYMPEPNIHDQTQVLFDNLYKTMMKIYCKLSSRPTFWIETLRPRC